MIKYCKDCKTEIKNKGRCRSCAMKFRCGDIKNHPSYGRKRSEKLKKLLSKLKKGKKFNEETRKKFQKQTELEAIKNGSIRNWTKWKEFRKEILERDNYKCQICNNKADSIHHKQPKDLFPELCWVKENVISICKNCHCKLESPAKKGLEIRELCKISHKQALDKGFWVRDKQGKLVFRNLSELLMLCVTDLGEACEALRKCNRQIRSKNPKWRKSDGWAKDTFEDELADTVIRIADLCEAEGIDLEWQIIQKLAYNKTRPEKHGKKF